MNMNILETGIEKLKEALVKNSPLIKGALFSILFSLGLTSCQTMQCLDEPSDYLPPTPTGMTIVKSTILTSNEQEQNLTPDITIYYTNDIIDTEPPTSGIKIYCNTGDLEKDKQQAKGIFATLIDIYNLNEMGQQLVNSAILQGVSIIPKSEMLGSFGSYRSQNNTININDEYFLNPCNCNETYILNRNILLGTILHELMHAFLDHNGFIDSIYDINAKEAALFDGTIDELIITLVIAIMLGSDNELKAHYNGYTPNPKESIETNFNEFLKEVKRGWRNYYVEYGMTHFKHPDHNTPSENEKYIQITLKIFKDFLALLPDFPVSDKFFDDLLTITYESIPEKYQDQIEYAIPLNREQRAAYYKEIYPSNTK